PDMKLPIQYALAYPRRIVSGFERFKFSDYPTLSFEAPDTNTFPNLGLAYMALEKGGTMPCVLNAANEIAVESFLKDHIGFLQMSEVIEQCLGKCSFIARPSLDDLYRSDEEARQYAREIIKKQIK
ncbi:MAG: 1-deoxy-D-xylulose-5-phosphate reductoisomerase, partial [Bacteroidales bacterium]|nr:1-deoxy-D-xylulose-5-phosphate reductoisomerase [Bacteroidales bacterium]